MTEDLDQKVVPYPSLSIGGLTPDGQFVVKTGYLLFPEQLKELRKKYLKTTEQR